MTLVEQRELLNYCSHVCNRGQRGTKNTKNQQKSPEWMKAAVNQLAPAAILKNSELSVDFPPLLLLL